MHILGRLQSLFGGFIPMDSVICLKHLSSVYYHLGFGFFVLGNFKEMSEIFGLFLLLAFGFKSFYSLCFPTHSTQISSKNTFYSGKVADAKLNRNLDKKYDFGNDSEKCGSDASALRNLVKMERRRADAARAEVEREWAASATAVEEAMAMIRRLQSEKSSIEMEFNQHRRLSEARRAHDEEVIQSLEWLVQTCEAELSSLRRELRLFESDGRDESVPIASPILV